MAEALSNLSDQTRSLVKGEIDTALRESWAKAKRSWPPAALIAASGVLILLTAASSYRLSLRLLEKRLSPAGAALAATAVYGAAAAAAAALGLRQLRDVPVPLPTQTVRQASGAVAGAASQAARAPVPGEPVPGESGTQHPAPAGDPAARAGGGGSDS
jgi:Putative Actinobacterial Holin-X, holin superfamily III